MPTRTVLLAIATLAMSFAALPGTAHAACTTITTPAGLDQVRADLAGEYCLANDLDMAGFGSFVPIGTELHPFTGTFDGQGHVIRNLTVRSKRDAIGLFGMVDGGQISNVTMASVLVQSAQATFFAGGIAGYLTGTGQISNVRVTGLVRCRGDLCRQGGIVGESTPNTIISDAWSDAFIEGGSGGAAGGVAGQISGQVNRSYATGPVTCVNNCAAGGLVGWMTDDASAATDSFSTGPVRTHDANFSGGFAGYLGGTSTRTYTTSSVKIWTGIAGGFAGDFAGPTSEAFAAGRVKGRSGSTLGGFAGALGQDEPADSSYWDRKTSRQTFTVRGISRTTAQLQSHLPPGFGTGWGITRGFSYPYLSLFTGGMYASTLATVVVNRLIYTFVPLGQNEPTEYLAAPAHADAASLAAVYTMVARAISLTEDVDALEGVKIDQDFWNDGTQTATWAGPVTSHASLDNVVALGSGAVIDDSNVIGELKLGRVVAIRGTYTPQGGGSAEHWMLATLFTAAGNGRVTALVANDPWTGRQVRIDPTTKQVVFPAGFPLAGFTVDGYRVITLNGGV